MEKVSYSDTNSCLKVEFKEHVNNEGIGTFGLGVFRKNFFFYSYIGSKVSVLEVSFISNS